MAEEWRDGRREGSGRKAEESVADVFVVRVVRGWWVWMMKRQWYQKQTRTHHTTKTTVGSPAGRTSPEMTGGMGPSNDPEAESRASTVQTHLAEDRMEVEDPRRRPAAAAAAGADSSLGTTAGAGQSTGD